jgi:hypothetical protein
LTAKILDFTGVTSLDIDPERVLAKAKGQLQAVIVIGYDGDGELYVATSYADGGDMLWAIDQAKKKLLEMAP